MSYFSAVSSGNTGSVMAFLLHRSLTTYACPQGIMICPKNWGAMYCRIMASNWILYVQPVYIIYNLMYLLSCLFSSKLKLHMFSFVTNLQGTKKSLNALFSNVHRVLHNVLGGYKYTHLKRQNIVKLIKERDYMSGKLERHLNKTSII